MLSIAPIKWLNNFVICCWQAAVDTVNHDGIEHAGYLSFLGILSLFPFLVLLVALAGIIGNHQVGQEFVSILLGYMPSHAVDAIKPRINEIVSGPPQGILTIAIIGALWTASSAVEGLRTALNRAYRVHTPPAYPLRRLLSIAQLLIILCIIIMVMAGWVFTPILLEYAESALHISLTDSTRYTGLAISSGIILLVVSSIYYFLPNIRQDWTETMPGAVLVLALWMLCAAALSTYLSKFNQVNLIYGSLGGFIAVLLFFYIISLVIIFGAEFNYLFEKSRGHELAERENISK
jgi:membrane protein